MQYGSPRFVPSCTSVNENARTQKLKTSQYTGAFSGCAAAGGAAAVTAVDLSRTYLATAERNMALNGFGGEASQSARYPFVRSDVGAFLRAARQNRQ